MYRPAHYREDDVPTLHALMRAHSFALVVTPGPAGLRATHLPLVLDADAGPCGALRGHLARANEQWRQFRDGAESLAVFQGPHAYVSPQWYANGPSVPTWNYVAVHAYGAPRVIEDRADARAALDELTASYEAAFPRPWRMTGEPEAYMDTMLRHIVVFEIPIRRLEGKIKLNQRQTAADRAGVIAGLRAVGDPRSVAVADLMAAREAAGS